MYIANSKGGNIVMTRYTLLHETIQAPMAGITTPKFVEACCKAGMLGSIGAGYLNGEETLKFIQEVKNLTTKPFNVNLFVPEQSGFDQTVIQKARQELQPFYDELGITETPHIVSTEVFNEQIQAIIDEDVKIVSFTFGIPSIATITKLKEHGIYLIGTATTVEEVIAVEQAGLDAVVVQGREAGGHRGSFTEPLQLITTTELLENVREIVTIPLIAAGGIMTAEHVKEMLQLGATSVQLGTILLTAYECEISRTHKEAILNSGQQATTLTKAFTGKYARGLKNRFTEELKEAVTAPYPLQHYLTQPIRKESARQNNLEYMSLWMGENSYLAKEASVKEIIETLLQ